MMLVGGSVIRVPQVEGYLAEKRNVHSLDGHCRPFDAIGQGTIFGSGVGAVLLKPLRQAIADRDHVFAVIKGTAANNDGSAKNSYTAPSLGQQSQAVADALKSAGISADSVGYVECHATGTLVGDPTRNRSADHGFSKADRPQTVLRRRLSQGQYRASRTSGRNRRSYQNRACASSQANPAEHQFSHAEPRDRFRIVAVLRQRRRSRIFPVPVRRAAPASTAWGLAARMFSRSSRRHRQSLCRRSVARAHALPHYTFSQKR